MTPAAIESFQLLKNALSTAPVLAQPNFTKEFIIQCDASMVGVGGVLYQFDDQDQERPIAFVSKKLNKAQRNYTVTELECMAATLCIFRFRHCIEGIPFRVITDHSSLQWLLNQKELTGRLARWCVQVQRFNFTVEHRKGSLNVVPDTLSRFEVDEIVVTDLGFDVDLESPEFTGEEYTTLLETVHENTAKLPDLRISDNFIYKRVKFRKGIEDEEDNLWRLWVSKSLSKSIIENVHNSSMGCHGGYVKTLERIRKKYYWPTMSLDVRQFVKACSICNQVKSPNQIMRLPIGKAFITLRPFQRMYCDFLGPYTCSKSQNSYLFIVLDHFSKYLFLKPMRAATSSKVIEFFQNELFCSVGVP